MYYINYDEDTGTIIGIYPASYSFDEIPDPKITITDEQYDALGEDYYIVRDGVLVKESEERGEIPNNGNSDTAGAIYSLQNNYTAKLEMLKKAYLATLIMEADDAMDTVKNEYQNLLSEFTRKAIDIEEGTAPITTGEYCAMCGTLIVDGVCPNCHWRA